VLEVASRPLLGALGAEVSLWLEGLATEAGVELRTSQRIVDVKFAEDSFAVSFDDDVDLVVRAVVVGAGAVPNVEWLATSGLEIDNVWWSMRVSSRPTGGGDWRLAVFRGETSLAPSGCASSIGRLPTTTPRTSRTCWSPARNCLAMIPISGPTNTARRSRCSVIPDGSDHAQIVSGSVAQASGRRSTREMAY